MSNKNENHFSPIFENVGEPSTTPVSSSRSNKPGSKRAREETTSRPHAPAAQHAIEAPPATSDPLTSLTNLASLTKLLGPFTVILERFKILTKISDELAHDEQRIDDFHLRLEELEAAKDDVHPTPAPAPAATTCKHEETIAALQKQV
jgi:hypothetical protein